MDSKLKPKMNVKISGETHERALEFKRKTGVSVSHTVEKGANLFMDTLENEEDKPNSPD